jgi:O-antigen ligase
MHRMRRLAAQGAVVAMAIGLLLVADSKTSLACFVLVGGLMTVTGRSRLARRPVVLHTIIISLILGCFAVLFLGAGRGVLEKIGRDQSLTGRTDIWKAALSRVENPLLGAGYESFWLGERLAAIVRVIGGGNQAHNGYIEIYLNLGWVGLALLGVLIVTGYRRIISGFRRGANVSLLSMAYFIVAIVYNFTEGSFKMMSPIWIAFLVAIMGGVPIIAVSRHRYSVEPASGSFTRASDKSVGSILPHVL